MIRISEYWILWAARLEVEIARAWQRGDPQEWRLLKEARAQALEFSERLREPQIAEQRYDPPPHLTSGFSGVDFTHW